MTAKWSDVRRAKGAPERESDTPRADVVALIVDAIGRLPVHSIGGYEWDCDNCHYHSPIWIADDVESELCTTCGTDIRRGEETTEHDPDGRPCDHRELLDRNAVLRLLRGDPFAEPSA